MQYSEYVKEFNRNALIKNFKIVDTGGLSGVEHRKKLIDKYTGTFTSGDITIGIKPFSRVENDLFVLDFEVTVLAEDTSNSSNTHLSLFNATKEQENFKSLIKRLCDEIVQGDLDIDSEFDSNDFTYYYGTS